MCDGRPCVHDAETATTAQLQRLREAHVTATASRTQLATNDLLTEDMLARFDERAPVYDREHRFFQEDFDELRDRGYLNAAVPTAFGGLGLSFADVQAMQRRLAYVAPATALAVNMHFYWTGLAAGLSGAGDSSFDWMLRASADGAVFAAGHGEAGNDIPLLLSSSKAERVDGGWEITGHKIFGSLSPVWTYLGVHAMDTSDPENPQVVHAFMPRTAEGYRIENTWDVLGMRATESNDTILDHVFVADEHVALVARPASPVRDRSRSRYSRGACSASPRSTPRSRSARTTRRFARCIAATRSR